MRARVLVRVDGGHRRGMGHIFRMRALGLALRDRRVEVRCCTAAGTAGERVLREASLEVDAVTDEALVPDDALLTGHDLVIVDRLDQGEELAALRARWSGGIVCFDDNGSGLEHADAVINALAWHARSGSPRRARLYEGPEYVVLDERIREQASVARPVRERVVRLLLAFGGSDDHDLAARVLPALSLPALESATVRVHRGPACEPSAALARALAADERATLATDDFLDELCAADLVLCAGGVMLHELAALGVPTAAIAAESPERATIRFFAERGATVDLGYEGTLDEAELAPKLSAVLRDASARAALAGAGRRLVDGHGLLRCLAILEELLPR